MNLRPSLLVRPEGAGRSVSAPLRRAAVFLDKDGTLVEDVPYNVDPQLLRFTPNAVAGLQQMVQLGYVLVVVSNQSGLARGYFNRSQLGRLQRALCQKVKDEAGVELAGFYACPHLPGPRDVPACLCRKPAAGMLKQAALALNLDLSRSWMVGDILHDVEAGRRAGCRTVLLDVGNETEWRLSPLRTPHHRCADLREAARCMAQAAAQKDTAADAPRNAHA
ncbi:MAG: HAD family hydrolase [Pseudomonadota bacterium]